MSGTETIAGLGLSVAKDNFFHGMMWGQNQAVVAWFYLRGVSYRDGRRCKGSGHRREGVQYCGKIVT